MILGIYDSSIRLFRLIIIYIILCNKVILHSGKMEIIAQGSEGVIFK